MEANASQMASGSSERSSGNNGLGSSHDPGSPLVGQLIQRVKRRRADLKTLNGVARESAKIYRALAQGTLQPAAAEVRSRVLRRHGELLATIKLEQMQRDFDEFRSRPTLQNGFGDYGNDPAITQDPAP
jgi:hypothetical protein